MEGCWGLDLQAAGDSPVFHAAGFVILVPKFSTLGLKFFLMYFLWPILGKLLGFSVFLALDTLISISCHLRATGGRLKGLCFHCKCIIFDKYLVIF